MRGIGLVALVAPMAVFAKPMIDEAHDRVQTTLDPMMDRIGTLTPRSARESPPESALRRGLAGEPARTGPLLGKREDRYSGTEEGSF